mmetsp:Transcript_1345/g.2867  ORF Transcript_1345/g.2867 Transcript_1345/m.2867 type:complete len:258 (+) Transcript_1345:95-868(+)
MKLPHLPFHGKDEAYPVTDKSCIVGTAPNHQAHHPPKDQSTPNAQNTTFCYRANRSSFLSFSPTFRPVENNPARTGLDATAEATLDRAAAAAPPRIPPAPFRGAEEEDVVVGRALFSLLAFTMACDSPATVVLLPLQPPPSAFLRFLSLFFTFLANNSSSLFRSSRSRIASKVPPAVGGASRTISSASNGPYSARNASAPISLTARSLKTFGLPSESASPQPSLSWAFPFLSFLLTTRNAGTDPVSSAPDMGQAGTH